MSTPSISEEWARNMLLLAIRDGQAAELIQCLWDGGTFTLSPEPRNFRLVFLPKDLIDQVVNRAGENP